MIGRIRRQIAAGHAAAKDFVFSGGSGGYSPGGYFGFGGLYPSLPGANYDYRREAGNLWENGAVLACISWLARVWASAPPAVFRPVPADRGQKGDKSVWTPSERYLEAVKCLHPWAKASVPMEMAPVAGHPLAQLLSHPNDYYDASCLWGGTILSLIVAGNSYWFKVRGPIGNVIGLIYIPHYQIEPRWPKDGSAFISHYEYRVGNYKTSFDPSQIVHLRHGIIDPLNTRKSLSPLAGVIREVCTDNEAATFSAAILRNMGIPGVVISPKNLPNGEIVEMTDEQQSAFKRKWREKFGGDNRGEPFVQTVPVDVEVPGFSPRNLSVDAMRDIPEERITAAIGLPAVVVGLGVGLQHSSDKNNITTANEMAWKNCVIPLKSGVAGQVAHQLGGDVLMFKPGDVLGWDYTGVAALQEDLDARHKRIRDDWMSGMTTRAQARMQHGWDVDEARDDVYYTDLVPPMKSAGAAQTDKE